MIYIGDHSIYAVHIPPAGADEVKAGGDAFVNLVLNNEGAGGKQNYLIGFANGTNRTLASADMITGKEELRRAKKGLGSPRTDFCQIMKHLGPNSGGTQADGVVIMLEQTHVSEFAPHGCLIYYKRDADVQWVNGGNDASGQYKPRVNYLGAKIPSDLYGLWHRIDDDNCVTTKI